MQAFIPAAGLGTRLSPLTEHRPKALVEVDGTPLLKIVIDRLSQFGISRVVVNVHHFADMVCDYIHSSKWNADIVVSDETEMLLDTGGGLKKAEPLFNPVEPILIHNVDVLSAIDFHAMEQTHMRNKNMATLAVSDRNTSRLLLFDSNQLLAGWSNLNTGETKWVQSPTPTYRPVAFSGIAILHPQLLALMPPADHPYPIIPCYLDIAKTHRISSFVHSSSLWMDVGTPQRLSQAQSWYRSLPK